MSGTFNAYHVWLGIPPEEQPPNHYRLLGITVFESDLDVIDHAADRQMAHVRTFQTGRNAPLSQQLLNELAAARLCLMNAEKKAAYDEPLRAKLQTSAQAAVPVAKAAVPMAKPLPVAKPVVAAKPISPGGAATRVTPVGSVVPGRGTDDDEIEISSDFDPAAVSLPEGMSHFPARRRRYGRSSQWRSYVGLAIVAAAAIFSFMLLYYFIKWVSSGKWQESLEYFNVPSVTSPAGDTPEKAPPGPPSPAPAPPPPDPR